MFIFLLFQTQASCPKFTCGSYSSHLCAVFSDDSIQLSPCLNNDHCDIEALYTNFQAGQTSLQCTPQPTGTKSSIFQLMHEICSSVPNTGKKLQGSHPKVCVSNNDCILNDGSFAECKCGLSVNGLSYCDLSEGDELNIDLQKAACLQDFDSFVYLLMKIEFFVYLHDRPNCAGFVFDDLAVVDFIQAGGSFAQKKLSESSGRILVIGLFLYLYLYL